MEQVILVNEQDEQIGLMEKQEAHLKGLLHRAFSVFIFNDKNQMLMQRRALSKYHSGGLWTNSCCSHPRDNENIDAAAKRRLQEELGFECKVEHVFSFTYKAELDNGLTEHEFDHVFIGRYSNDPNPNKNEVMDWEYVDLADLQLDIKENPERYTIWFLEIFERVQEHIIKLIQ